MHFLTKCVVTQVLEKLFLKRKGLSLSYTSTKGIGQRAEKIQ